MKLGPFGTCHLYDHSPGERSGRPRWREAALLLLEPAAVEITCGLRYDHHIGDEEVFGVGRCSRCGRAVVSHEATPLDSARFLPTPPRPRLARMLGKAVAGSRLVAIMVGQRTWGEVAHRRPRRWPTSISAPRAEATSGSRQLGSRSVGRASILAQRIPESIEHNDVHEHHIIGGGGITWAYEAISRQSLSSLSCHF